LGFSPRAIFTPAGNRMTIESTTEPAAFRAVSWPPIGLAEPWEMPSVVTPPRRASSKPRSSGWMASIVRVCAVMASESSLPS
jgi:hypothetical protein